MDRQQITEIARKTMASRKSIMTRETGHLFRHGMRVGLLSEKIAAEVEGGGSLERDILFCAGLFHDIGKGMEPHNETGAVLVRTLLRNVCSPGEIDQVACLVSQHNRRHQPEASPAVKIVQDADVLDHVGTHSVWMGCVFNADQELGPEGYIRYYFSQENERYIQSMRSAVNLDVSRRIFDQRLAFEQAFVSRFRDEMAGAF